MIRRISLKLWNKLHAGLTTFPKLWNKLRTKLVKLWSKTRTLYLKLWNKFRARFTIFQNIFIQSTDTLLAVSGTVFGVAFGVKEILSFARIGTFLQWLGLDNLRLEPVRNFYDHSSVQALLVITLLVVSFFVTYKVLRYDPKLFARLVSNGVYNDYLIRLLSGECRRVIRKFEGVEGARIFRIIDKTRPDILRIEELKTIVAARLNLETKEFCEGFLNFSPSIFIHRQSKKALNTMGNLVDANGRNEESELIKENVKESIARLDALEKYNIDFNKFFFLFESKSTLVQMLYLTDMINEVARSGEDPELLYQLQKASLNGVMFCRLVSLVILGSRFYYGDEKPPFPQRRWENQIKFFAEQTGAPVDKSRLSEEEKAEWQGDWVKQINDLLEEMFDQIADDVEQILRRVVSNRKSSRVYIVTQNYSRLVRVVLGKVAKSMLLSDLQLCIVSGNSASTDMGSRLLHHQLIHEHPGRSCFRDKGNIFIGSEDQVLAKLAEARSCGGQTDDEKVKVLYWTGCEMFTSHPEIVNAKANSTTVFFKSKPEVYKRIRKEGFDCSLWVLAARHKDLDIVGHVDKDCQDAVDMLKKYFPKGTGRMYHCDEAFTLFTNKEGRKGTPLDEPTPLTGIGSIKAHFDKSNSVY